MMSLNMPSSSASMRAPFKRQTRSCLAAPQLSAARRSARPSRGRGFAVAARVQLPGTGGDAPNVGTHIAHRLVEIGCTEFFGVAGDFNLLLLDQLIKEPKLQPVWCCNELNAGYAADGYARQRGVGCVVVTFTVGGLSVINAIAGAYSEDLPIIVVSGGPNSNDFATNRVLHHTTGDPNFEQQLRCFKEVTCHQALISHVEDAHRQVDEAIAECLLKRKPVYIEVCCNLSSLPHPSFQPHPVPYALTSRTSNPKSLEAAVEAAAAVLNAGVKPTLLGGVHMRHGDARHSFLKLADASEYPVAILPDAKGMFPESYPRFMGLYWGAVSSPVVCEMVESSDILVTVGAVWTDYTTVGYSLLLNPSKTIEVQDGCVTILGGRKFGCIRLNDFLLALAEKVKPNNTGFVNFTRMYVPPSPPPTQPPNEMLHSNVLFKHIQSSLTSSHALLSEVGDSWFNTQMVKLPDGCPYEMQMRYGSIGWSVGALLGYQTAFGKTKRVLACIGDGSFQMTAQEVSTMIRYQLNPIIILINNGGYTIEAEIHDGPYNVIKNWDYVAFAKALHNGEGNLWTAKAHTEAELITALEGAAEHPDHCCFIEVTLHKDDCSKELLEWGSRVAAANARGPTSHT